MIISRALRVAILSFKFYSMSIKDNYTLKFIIKCDKNKGYAYEL